MSYASSIGLPDVSTWTDSGNVLMDLWYGTTSEAPYSVVDIEWRAPEEIAELGMPEPEYEDTENAEITRYPGGWEERWSFASDVGCGDPTCPLCRWGID